LLPNKGVLYLMTEDLQYR